MFRNAHQSISLTQVTPYVLVFVNVLKVFTVTKKSVSVSRNVLRVSPMRMKTDYACPLANCLNSENQSREYVPDNVKMASLLIITQLSASLSAQKTSSVTQNLVSAWLSAQKVLSPTL